MSRRKSSSRRVTNYNANRRLPTGMSPSRSLSPMISLEDRRTYHPMGMFSPARSFSQPRHRLVIAHATKPQPSPSRYRMPTYSNAVPVGVAFKAPDRVLVCVRRKMRKEVMHALNKAGKSGQKPPRRSEYSSIKC